MPDKVEALRWRKQFKRDRDELDDLVEGTRPRRAQEGLQLGKRLFDRIEVRTVRRQEADLGADGFDRAVDRGLFVYREVSSTTTSPGRNVGTRTCST